MYSIKQGIFYKDSYEMNAKFWRAKLSIKYSKKLLYPFTFCSFFLFHCRFTIHFFICFFVELQFTFFAYSCPKTNYFEIKTFLFVHTLQIGILVFANFLSVCVYSVNFVHPHLNFNLWQNYLRVAVGRSENPWGFYTNNSNNAMCKP